MSNFNYSLDIDSYSWTNALLWGNFVGHCKKACEGSISTRTIVHLIISAVELLPIISQIASIFEKIIVTYFKTSKHHSSHILKIQSPLQSSDATPKQIPKPPNLWTQEEIRRYHHQIASSAIMQSPFIIWSRWSDANIMPSMQGIAKIGTFLMDKHQFPRNNLFVCNTLKIFKEELEKIQNNMSAEGDFRRAFIVATHSTLWGQNKEGIVPKRTEDFAQHMLAVAVEKKGNKLHIALLDPFIRHGNENINPAHIGLNSQLENVPFSEQELILSYIINAGLNPDTTVLYHSNVLREKSNGCWAFALKDAIAFLKSPNFFDNYKDTSISKVVHNLKLIMIRTLPVNFMKTAQFSNHEFDEYFQQHPEQNVQNIRVKIAKHQIQNQNQRIGHATVKWLQLLTSTSSA